MSGATRAMSPARTDLGVYLVTDAAQAERRGRDLVTTVAAAVEGGVRCVQLRDKDAAGAAVLELLEGLGRVVPHDVPLLVNDRLDVLLAARDRGVRVDGVHLGQSDGSAAEARAAIGPDLMLGVSASTPEQLRAAARDGADHVGIGAVHATSTKPDAPAPLGIGGACALAAVAADLGLAPVAIGGLGADDLAPLRSGGFVGAAVVSAVCAAADPRAAARSLARSWDDAR